MNGSSIQPERAWQSCAACALSTWAHQYLAMRISHIRKKVAFSYNVFERRRDEPLVDVTVNPETPR